MAANRGLLMIGKLVLASFLLFVFGAARAADHRSFPNIVVILADDFGVGDIQAHFPENRIPTPNLDRLAQRGMSFTDAHSSSAVCSPTRYGLLTGRYNWRTRLQEWVIAAYEPPLIASDRPSLPGILRQHGYYTGCIGKWHLGWNWPGPQQSQMTERRNAQAFLQWELSQPIQGGPIACGFDEYFGVDLPNLPPFTFIENDRALPLPTSVFHPDPTEGIVLPIQFAGAPAAPNWRMQEILPTITQRAVKFVHNRAGAKAPFFLYFALTSPHEPVVPSESFQGKSGIAPIADFVMETDWSVGQVVKAIDDAGIANDTLVIFTADNGHSHYTGWQELLDAGHLPSGPFRGHKGDIWEGGHRVPLIVRWPERVQANSRSNQLVCLTDLFATCADIIDADLPKNGAEDSISFLPELIGDTSDHLRQSLVNHSNNGEFAFREGSWKLIFQMSEKDLQASRGKKTVVHLFNLQSDIAETKDLAQECPEVVARMTENLRRLIERGASRLELNSANDTVIRFDTTQTERWAPPIN